MEGLVVEGHRINDLCNVWIQFSRITISVTGRAVMTFRYRG